MGGGSRTPMHLSWDRFGISRPLNIKKKEKKRDSNSLVIFNLSSATETQQENKETAHL